MITAARGIFICIIVSDARDRKLIWKWSGSVKKPAAFRKRCGCHSSQIGRKGFISACTIICGAPTFRCGWKMTASFDSSSASWITGNCTWRRIMLPLERRNIHGELVGHSDRLAGRRGGWAASPAGRRNGAAGGRYRWQFHYSHQRSSVFRVMVTGTRRRAYSRVAQLALVYAFSRHFRSDSLSDYQHYAAAPWQHHDGGADHHWPTGFGRYR